MTKSDLLTVGQRVDRVLLALHLSTQGDALDYSREVVSSSPEKSSEPPLVDMTAEVMSFIFERFASRLEQFAAGERSLQMTRAELRESVRLLSGYPSGLVALLLGALPEDVERVRAGFGMDPDFGLSKPRPLTAPPEEQLEVNDQLIDDYEWSFDAWKYVSTPEAIYGLEKQEAPVHGNWTATEDAGVSDRRYYEDRTAPGSMKDATSPDAAMAFGGDPAGEWLRANDPRQRAEGVTAEIEAALTAEGMDLESARGAFRKSGGRPTAQIAHLRSRVAAALTGLWDDDGRRDFMADALDCDRTTLWRLMSKTATRLN